MAKICSVCKAWQAPGPTDTVMTCPHDGSVATVSRCRICSLAPRANGIVASAEEVALNTAGKHNGVPGYHPFE